LKGLVEDIGDALNLKRIYMQPPAVFLLQSTYIQTGQTCTICILICFQRTISRGDSHHMYGLSLLDSSLSFATHTEMKKTKQTLIDLLPPSTVEKWAPNIIVE
jgi:hypothetical protein